MDGWPAAMGVFRGPGEQAEAQEMWESAHWQHNIRKLAVNQATIYIFYSHAKKQEMGTCQHISKLYIEEFKDGVISRTAAKLNCPFFPSKYLLILFCSCP